MNKYSRIHFTGMCQKAWLSVVLKQMDMKNLLIPGLTGYDDVIHCLLSD